MQEEQEPVGHCENCGKAIMEGDQYGPCTDGIMLCEKHTFLLSDAIRQLQELADAGLGDNDMREPEDVVEDLASLRADFAANGDRKILYTA